uniref:tRNA-splicing endonuclease subunit Sen54 N-terminal domain-containing protein n=1 Tax=Leersia perrieri TaxID=77586 RepID=A0A0D9XFD1_9ORYZ
MALPPTRTDHRRRRVAVAGEDDGEESHLDPFLDDSPPSSSKVQFWKVASRAVWVEEAGAAEVVDSKGKLWLTTGVTRDGKLYYNVEEIGFLAERGALVLLDDEGETIGMEEIYGKIAGGKYGCTWGAFQAYKHLKLLGYIIGRYDVSWTVKRNHDSSMSVVGTDQSLNRIGGACNDITKLLKKMCIDDIHPFFEVYLPNSKFKKTSPGDPNFLLCLLSNKPPSRGKLEEVENKFEGIPLKFCHVDNGRVSFLSFNKAALPSLP